MKKLLSAVLLSLTVSLPMMAANENLKLSYNKPATVWEEALPLGNGFIGAMMYGGVDAELIRDRKSVV